MKFLSDYSTAGTLITWFVVVVLYIVVSFKIFNYARSKGMHVSISSFTPVIQLVIFFIAVRKGTEVVEISKYSSEDSADAE